MKTGLIYIAINILSNKCYVGKTTKTLNDRIGKHYRDSFGRSYAFANALKKYKKDDWKWEIIYKNIPLRHLDTMERWVIGNYNTYHCGYNSTYGGEDNPMNYSEYRKKVSESKKGKSRPDQSIRISRLNKSREYSKQYRDRLSEQMSGKNNPMFGKTHSESSKLKAAISLGSKEFMVFCGDKLIGCWVNKSECARKLGVDNSSITKCLSGKKKHVGRYTFVYINGEI